ncbi:MAG: class I SAM-dependent methyltransferase [Archangium sp.]
MKTLHQQPFASVLQELETRANASDGEARARLGSMSPPEREALMTQMRADPTKFYGGLAKDLFLAVSPQTRQLLYLLARSSNARHVIEFGTSFGVSTLFLAAAVRDNGGGRVITCEFEPAKAATARATFVKAGISELIDLREGDAQKTLAKDLPPQIDLVLLDGAKPLYPTIVKLLESRLKPGALLIADNADDSPDYLELVHNDRRFHSLAWSDEVEITCFDP